MKVRTMRGKMLDMSNLIAQNGKAIALGNASMNARGDIIGRNGAVVKPREALTQEYNAANPRAVKQVALRDISNEVFVSPTEAAAKAFGTPESAKPSPVKPTTHRTRKIEDRED